MTLPYIYQSTHSISFLLSALTHSISLPCKMDGKEGQSVDADFWHPVESNSHQHRRSKFLMKSRIIWSNYDHNQQSMIKNSRLHLVACNRNKRSTLHALHVLHIAHHFMHYFTSFHVAFRIISCHISYISLHISHTLHTRHACRALRISRTARISCIAPYVTSFYVSFHVIFSWNFIAYSFIPFRSEESRKRVKMAHSSIERHLSGAFYSRG